MLSLAVISISISLWNDIDARRNFFDDLVSTEVAVAYVYADGHFFEKLIH